QARADTRAGHGSAGPAAPVKAGRYTAPRRVRRSRRRAGPHLWWIAARSAWQRKIGNLETETRAAHKDLRWRVSRGWPRSWHSVLLLSLRPMHLTSAKNPFLESVRRAAAAGRPM